MVLDGVSLRDNKADGGGAVIVGGSTSVRASGCLVPKNSSTAAARLYLYINNSFKLLSVTLVNNTAHDDGVGVRANHPAQVCCVGAEIGQQPLHTPATGHCAHSCSCSDSKSK